MPHTSRGYSIAPFADSDDDDNVLDDKKGASSSSAKPVMKSRYVEDILNGIV
jgi:hypothetical protein